MTALTLSTFSTPLSILLNTRLTLSHHTLSHHTLSHTLAPFLCTPTPLLYPQPYGIVGNGNNAIVVPPVELISIRRANGDMYPIFTNDCSEIPVSALNDAGLRIQQSGGYSDSSIASESISAHIMTETLPAILSSAVTLAATETEIQYQNCGSKKTDYLLAAGDLKLAVEVKRVFNGRKGAEVDVYRILYKANIGALESNHAVAASHRWNSQLLHVITPAAIIPRVCEWIAKNSGHLGFSAIFISRLPATSRAFCR